MYDKQKEALQQELSDLKEYYTTDIKEANENANKRYMTKEEMAAKELEIKKNNPGGTFTDTIAETNTGLIFLGCGGCSNCGGLYEDAWADIGYIKRRDGIPRYGALRGHCGYSMRRMLG
jgi:hypothetical protein